MRKEYVYVLNMHGEPLMPCSPAKARILCKNKKAKVVKRTPFTIQLLYGSTGYRQPVALGVDAGSKYIGLSATTEAEELFAQEVQPRNNVTKLLTARRTLRSSRRSRKRRHRKPRFENRVHSKHKGWLAPSVEVKIQEHITSILRVMKSLPVSKVIVETAEFDLQKLKAILNGKPLPKGTDYQHGEMAGFYNARQYVLWRDSYKCRCCGKTGGKLYVVNAEGQETGSPEDKYTVCQDCFKAGNFHFKKKRRWKHPTFMGIMRKTLITRLTDLLPDIEVEETTGAETKAKRELYGIEKSHVNDARCISGNPLAMPCASQYRTRAVRHHNRKLHKENFSKGGVRKSAQMPYLVKGFRLWDKVRCNGQECFITGRRASGSFALKDFDGDMVNAGISYKKLGLVEKGKYYITVKEKRLVLL